MPDNTLRRGGRKYFYWYVQSEDAGLGPVEVRPVGTTTWLTTEAATDPDGNDGYRILLAGPDVDQGSAVLQLTRSTVFEVRLVDTPEIEFSTGRIDVR